MSRTATSAVVPIWRSDAQPALLHAVFWWHTAPTASDVAERFGLTRQIVNREVHRLERAGILRSESVGRSRVLSIVADHPAVPALRQLVDLTVGPLVDLGHLYSLDGVESVYVFGSWARRHLGEAGPLPRDIDVLVVGDVDRYVVMESCLELSGRYGIDVNPIVIDTAEFEHPIEGSITEEIIRGARVAAVRP